MSNVNSIAKAAEYIAVMQAYVDGEAVEWRVKRSNDPTGWRDAGTPVWDFGGNDYRIKPKSKPQVNWAALHPKFQFVARDKNGSIWAFKTEPHISTEWDQWRTNISTAERISDTFSPEFLLPGDCDWTDSLISRDEAL